MEVADAFARSITKTNLVQAEKKNYHQFKQTYLEIRFATKNERKMGKHKHNEYDSWQPNLAKKELNDLRHRHVHFFEEIANWTVS